MVTVKPGDNILVGEDMVVEPFGSSHSVIEPLGFHTLTFLDGKAHAGESAAAQGFRITQFSSASAQHIHTPRRMVFS